MYESKAVTTKISATSRVAIKIHDNYYTVEYSEERSLPDLEGIDVETERMILFDDINKVVDAQAEDILNTFQKKKK